MNNTAKRIKKYKELKADIVDIDLRIQELEDNKLIESLTKDKKMKEVETKRIENALTVLIEPYNEIIEEALINGKRYSYLQEKLHLSYPRIKQLESEALKKMQKYIP